MSICLESARTRNILRSHEDSVMTGLSGSPPAHTGKVVGVQTLLFCWFQPHKWIQGQCVTQRIR